MSVPCITRRIGTDQQLAFQLYRSCIQHTRPHMYCPVLSHSPFYFSTTLDIFFILYIFTKFYLPVHSIVTLSFYLTVYPVVITSSNLFITHKLFYKLNSLSAIYFRHTAYSICISSISDESKKLPDDGRLLPKHVGASILNKGAVQFSAQCSLFLLRCLFPS
jgi:hypothetical protein